MRTRIFRTLVHKELLHHRWAFLGMILLVIIHHIVLIFRAATDANALTMFSISGIFLSFAIPLLALILGNRLVVSEYYGRTQLFIEALPVPRWQMVTVKFVIGLVFLSGVMALDLLVVAGLASRAEPIGVVFLLRLLVTSLTFIFLVWSLFFAMGFVGRLRFPIYLCGALALIYLDGALQLRLTEVGPLKLVWPPEAFGLERDHLPLISMLQTALLGGAFLGLAFVLAVVREGSVAEILARRMSQREKAVASFFVLGFLVAFYTLDTKSEKPPFEFTEEHVTRSDKFPIAVLHGRPSRAETATQLVEYLDNVLGGLVAALKIDKLPPIRIAYYGSLDGDVYQLGKASERDGILVRVNFEDKERWRDADFSYYLIHAVITHRTRGRAGYEPKHWLLDGFAIWWTIESASSDDRDELVKLYMSRALYGARQRNLKQEQLRSWTVYQERVGNHISTAVAYSGLKYLEQIQGRKSVLDLARTILGRQTYQDVREMFYELRHPMAVVFLETTGIAWEEFVDQWSGWLQQELEAPHRQYMADIPEMTGTIEQQKSTTGINELVYEFEADKEPAEGLTCTFLHMELPPFDSGIPEHLLKREERPCRGNLGKPMRAAGLYDGGQRAFVALEADVESLACRVRFVARWIEVGP